MAKKTPDLVRAFAEYKTASFSDDGKYFLKYDVTYINIDTKKVVTSSLVVDCNLKDGVDLLRNRVVDAVKRHGNNLGIEVPDNGVFAHDFFKG